MDSTDRKLADLLLQRSLITPDQDRHARASQTRDRVSYADALVAFGTLTRSEVLPILEEIHGVPAIDLTVTFGDPLILDSVPSDKAFQMDVLPLFLVDKQLTIAVANPSNLAQMDELRAITGKKILPVVALANDIRRTLVQCYGDRRGRGESVLVEDIEFEATQGEAPATELSLDGVEGDAPVVRLLNLILQRAIEERASDIHIESGETQIMVRTRVDGLLRVKPYGIPLSVLPALISRIKILSSIDISERRLPQDGKIRLRTTGRAVDVRVSTFPTIREEKVVMRLLDKGRVQPRLEELSMLPEVLAAWKKASRTHSGIVLVTGPTGSGKSSTLFATLRHLQGPEVNIVTLEDPVEYEMTGLCQSQINERAGFTFARGLRAILRQDPDIILVGEIRDAETASIAVQAALTGHTVLASLHTNDAPSAITRLMDIGVPTYMISAALVGVLAQRLLRRVCPDCVYEATPTADERAYLGGWIGNLPFLDGRGCVSCRGVGYNGRMALHEIVEISPKLKTLIGLGTSAPQIAAAAETEGYRTLWANGLILVRQGITTLRELARVVDRDPFEATPPGD